MLQRRALGMVISMVLMAMLVGCGLPGSNAAAQPPAPTQPSNPPTLPPASGTPGATSLDGSKWRLQSLGPRGAAQPVAGSVALTLEFLGGSRAGGNGGCNTFGGNYSLSGQTIKFSDVVSTMRACADDALSQQEGRYLKALQTTGTYTVSGDSLTIEYDAGQSVLTFGRV